MLHAVFHGHSFVEIQMDDGSVLIDPFISGNPFIKEGISEFQQKNIKAIVLTHGHSDHLGDTVAIAKKNNSLVVATFELAKYLMEIEGVTNVHAMHIGGEHSFGDFQVKFTPAVHGGGIGDLKSGYTTFPAGVIIRADGKSIYHAGDTGLTYDMKLLGDFDKIDLAFLPIGSNFTMGVEDAVIATKLIKPKMVVPMHYDTFDLIKADPSEFARRIMLENISTPKVLNSGQYIVL